MYVTEYISSLLCTRARELQPESLSKTMYVYHIHVSNFAGSSDFFGINHYTTRLITPSAEPVGAGSQSAMMGYDEEVDPEWKRYNILDYSFVTLYPISSSHLLALHDPF